MFPISRIRIFLTRFRISQKDISTTDLDTFKHSQQVVDGQCRSFATTATIRVVCRAILICTFLDTLILQLIVICFTFGKLIILFNGDFRRQAIIVGTIVGDVQSTITIDEGQVAIAVQTTRVSCTQRDQVAVIDIVNGCGGITEHGGRVGIHSR